MIFAATVTSRRRRRSRNIRFLAPLFASAATRRFAAMPARYAAAVTFYADAAAICRSRVC